MILSIFSGGIPIISPIWNAIVSVFGWIMDFIFRGASSMGIANIGLCIIIFTIVTKIILFPMSYKQAKSQKLMSVIQPELKAVQAKYKGKEGDKKAMMMQQAEMQAVYDKYGTSVTGGCAQLLVQMPIIFALYRVIQNIPSYVPSVKVFFQNIVDAIGGSSAIVKVNEFAHSTDALKKLLSLARIPNQEIVSEGHIIDYLYHLNPEQMEQFKALFANASQVITENYEKIEKMNMFLGINLASAPKDYGLLSPKAWIIPVLAGLSQYFVTKLMSKAQPSGSEDDPAAQTMKSMNLMMPIMSVVFCFGFSSGIGIYWIASSVIMGVQQYFLNKHFDKMNIKALVSENIAKANAKRAKKGLPPINEKAAEENFRRMQEKADRLEAKQKAKLDATQGKINNANEYYHTSSIKERAKMIEQYNQKPKSKS